MVVKDQHVPFHVIVIIVNDRGVNGSFKLEYRMIRLRRLALHDSLESSVHSCPIHLSLFSEPFTFRLRFLSLPFSAYLDFVQDQLGNSRVLRPSLRTQVTAAIPILLAAKVGESWRRRSKHLILWGGHVKPDRRILSLGSLPSSVVRGRELPRRIVRHTHVGSEKLLWDLHIRCYQEPPGLGLYTVINRLRPC